LPDGLKPGVGFDKKTGNKVNGTVTKVSNLPDKFNKFKENLKARKQACGAKKDSLEKVKQNNGN